jgi:hypothetical protein
VRKQIAFAVITLGLSTLDASAQGRVLFDLAKKAVAAGTKTAPAAKTQASVPKRNPGIAEQCVKPAVPAVTNSQKAAEQNGSLVADVKNVYRRESAKGYVEKYKCYQKDNKTTGVGPLTKCTDEKKPRG